MESKFGGLRYLVCSAEEGDEGFAQPCRYRFSSPLHSHHVAKLLDPPGACGSAICSQDTNGHQATLKTVGWTVSHLDARDHKETLIFRDIEGESEDG